MQVSVENVTGLQRKLTVSIPNEEIAGDVDLKLQELAKTAKNIAGFRPGKVPVSVIRTRYLNSVRHEIASELFKKIFDSTIKEKELHLVSPPAVELSEKGEDFEYTALFEVFPELDIKEITSKKINLLKDDLTDEDVSWMLCEMQKQHREWEEVDRPAEMGDKVIIDIEGFKSPEGEFQANKIEGQTLILGAPTNKKEMETGLLGAKIDEARVISVDSTFDPITQFFLSEGMVDVHARLKKVFAPLDLPVLDDAFAKKLDKKFETLEDLKKELKEFMSNELERQVKARNKKTVFEMFLEANPCELPEAAIAQEIKELKHNYYHHLFGSHHSAHEEIPNFPDVWFEERAKHSVHLGIVLPQYIKQYNIKIDFKEGESRPSQLENMEKTIYEKLLENLSITEKKVNWQDMVQLKEQEGKA